MSIEIKHNDGILEIFENDVPRIRISDELFKELRGMKINILAELPGFLEGEFDPDAIDEMMKQLNKYYNENYSL